MEKNGVSPAHEAPVSDAYYDDKASSNKENYTVDVAPARRGTIHDGVWGDLDEDGPNYRGLGWVRTSIIMIKIQFGLGVLVMPSILDTLGMVPGIIILIVLGLLTSWTDWIVGTFKIAHPDVYTLADVGMLMFGKVGREVLFGMYWLYLIFVAAAGLLGASTALNALSEHALCTAIFVFICAVVVAGIAAIQTLDKISWFTWVGVVGIFSSLITLAIAVGIQDRPNAAPQAPLPWDKSVKAFNSPTLLEAMAAISTIIFSYSGTPAFFSVISEMRDPRQYNKSLIMCQSVVIGGFVILGAVVYSFCGIYVSSPALGSAGVTMKKVCYGLALPGLIAGAVINCHVPAKLVFVRIFRNSRHLSKNTPTHIITWLGCIFTNVSISFIIAEAIPVFGNLLSFAGALLSTPLCLTIECMMFIWEENRTGRLHKGMSMGRKILHAANFLLIIGSIFCMITGMWASIDAIRGDVKKGNTVAPFSCADNSNS
jgi:amino acid permease